MDVGCRIAANLSHFQQVCNITRLTKNLTTFEKNFCMPNLYIIAGCNGAGKTTASYTVLPEMLNCKEFVNADEIAMIGINHLQKIIL